MPSPQENIRDMGLVLLFTFYLVLIVIPMFLVVNLQLGPVLAFLVAAILLVTYWKVVHHYFKRWFEER